LISAGAPQGPGPAQGPGVVVVVPWGGSRGLSHCPSQEQGYGGGQHGQPHLRAFGTSLGMGTDQDVSLQAGPARLLCGHRQGRGKAWRGWASTARPISALRALTVFPVSLLCVAIHS